MRKIIGLLLTLSLAVGLLGAGLNAAFNLTGSATQTISLGGATGITVSTTTPGATLSGNVVSCPPLTINVMRSPSGQDTVGCNFTVSADGAAPSSVTIKFVSDAGFDPLKVTEKATGYSSLGLSPNPAVVTTTSTLPLLIDSHISWGTFASDGTGTPLIPDDGDGSNVFHTSFTIVATP